MPFHVLSSSLPKVAATHDVLDLVVLFENQVSISWVKTLCLSFDGYTRQWSCFTCHVFVKAIALKYAKTFSLWLKPKI